VTTAAKIIRALDLGSGYAKYNRLDKESGALEYLSFPSLAPRSSGLDLGMTASLLGARDTVVVDVDGTKYEVGPDSADLDTNDSTRSLNNSYIHTEQYKAVFLGALHYIGEPVIDLLVVGLPLNNMQAGAKLKAMVVGKHKINGTDTVEVKDALVIPQPMGGLYYCLSLAKEREELEFMDEEMNLIIDPGFLTYDFLLANGDKIIDNRSGAQNGGVSKVLRSIGESISAKFNITYDNLGALDKGLRRRKLKINGEIESLEDHIKATKSVVEGSVNHMKNLVGDGSDIDNIILLGGGSHIFHKTISAFYPKHTVIVIEDAQAANVRGFQMAGERVAGIKTKTK
jgi:plasmid segregation protein ParM